MKSPFVQTPDPTPFLSDRIPPRSRLARNRVRYSENGSLVCTQPSTVCVGKNKHAEKKSSKVFSSVQPRTHTAVVMRMVMLLYPSNRDSRPLFSRPAPEQCSHLCFIHLTPLLTLNSIFFSHSGWTACSYRRKQFPQRGTG